VTLAALVEVLEEGVPDLDMKAAPLRLSGYSFEPARCHSRAAAMFSHRPLWENTFLEEHLEPGGIEPPTSSMPLPR